MRKLSTVICLFYLLSACTKSDKDSLAEDNGCIDRIIIPVTAHAINNADIPVVNGLFQNNNVDNTNLRYYRYTHDSIQTYYPPYSKLDEKVVRVDQYTKGLRIMTGDMVFIFINDSFDLKVGYPTWGTYLNTNPHLSLGQVRKLFINDVDQFDHKANEYKDICLKAEFGYYNLNVSTGGSSENLVKAWRVTPKGTVHPSEYPVGYYQDDDGKRIYYFNGIETFH